MNWEVESEKIAEAVDFLYELFQGNAAISPTRLDFYMSKKWLTIKIEH